MSNPKIIPHFVADRPMSLRIISGLNLVKHPITIGIMLQACTSESFRERVGLFPCIDFNYCGVVDGPCPYNGNLVRCVRGQALKKHIIKISDSGVFTKQGANIDYRELFRRYNQMNIERGIILDVLGDKKKTIASAKKGLEIYQNFDYRFKLVGVAQGKNPQEYLECYEKLKKIGYDEIAIGGLLTKRQNTVRFAFAKNEFISCVVKKIKSEWPNDRCFTLGVYHPNRHELLESLGVDAADYKGWIFQYKKRYDDPALHHLDRIKQTRQFIDENILCKLSGKKASMNTNYKTSIDFKNIVQVVGKKVMLNSVNNLNANSCNQIVIVSCGKKKNRVRLCVAKDAYIGVPFRLKKEYAERSGKSWFILSAKYGLIRPKAIIDPNYDKTIRTQKDKLELGNKIRKQIPSNIEFSFVNEIVFLGPKAYVEALEYAIPKRRLIQINHVTKGLKQGESLSMLKKIVNNLNSN